MARRRRRAFRRRGRRRRVKIRSAGGIVCGKMHPPTSCASPWNTYVLTSTVDFSKDMNGQMCLSLNAIRKSLISELGLKVESIDIRCLRLDTWVPPVTQSTDKNYIVCAPCDWTSYSTCNYSRAIEWFEAWGTSVQPAHVHYVWPRSISNVVLPSDTDVVICVYDVVKSTIGYSYLIKVHIMWRPTTPDPRPSGVSGVLSSVRWNATVPVGGDSHVVTDDQVSVSPLTRLVIRAD